MPEKQLPQEGSRVRAVHFDFNPDRDAIDDNETVPPGTLGTVTGGSKGLGFEQIWVKWDNGSSISLLPQDKYEVMADA